MTRKLAWDHPEHTVEFTVDEIRELLRLAGFDEVEVRGVWISYDAQRDRVLPFDELGEVGGWDAHRRADEAAGRPAESFVWWAVGTRGERASDREGLERLVQHAYEVYRSDRLSHMHRTHGSVREENGRKVVTGRRGRAGHLLYGPYVPMRPGRWVARFRVAAGPTRWRKPDPDEPIGSIDVMVGDADPQVVAERQLTVRDLPLDGEERELELPFELENTEFGAQFRVHTLGRVRMRAEYPVEIE